MIGEGVEILFLTDHLGGREENQSLLELFQHLELLGHDVKLLCRAAGPGLGEFEVIESPGLGRWWQRPWTIRALDLHSDDQGPRLLQILSADMAEVGLDIAERGRIPYLLGVEEYPRRRSRLRLSRMWCRGIVSTNQELARSLVREYGVPSDLIRWIPRGVAVTPGVAGPSKAGKVPVVGAAGPLVRSSGFPTFLNAARRVIDSGLDAEFLIGGQGHDEGDLRRRAERLKISERLTFADELPIGLTFWEVLDLYCQTSIAPTSGRPLTLAMANGVPSIAADVEGLRSLIRDGETGRIVPPGDPAALAEAIIGLLLDREKAGLLGQEARRVVQEDHRPSLEAARLHALYRENVEDGLGPKDCGLARRQTAFDAGSGLDAGRVIGGIADPWTVPVDRPEPFRPAS